MWRRKPQHLDGRRHCRSYLVTSKRLRRPSQIFLNTVNGFINANADARNKVLGDWKALGGRTVLIDGIRTAFKNLGMIIAPIKEAFRDIFPATTGKRSLRMTVRI